jgi:hypothetical protein
LAVKGVRRAVVTLEGHEAVVTYDPHEATVDDLITAVSQARGPFPESAPFPYTATLKSPAR